MATLKHKIYCAGCALTALFLAAAKGYESYNIQMQDALASIGKTKPPS